MSDSTVLTHVSTLDQIARGHELAMDVLENLRDEVNSNPPLTSPTFTISDAAALVSRSASAIRLAEAEGRLPPQPRTEVGQRQRYNLKDLDHMREVFGTRPWRRESDEPAVIACQNFKGGVGKSTLTVHLSQYLAIRGYRVLVIDADAQATTTMNFGHVPDVDIAEDETLYATLRLVTPRPLEAVIRRTHYHNLDLIPANLQLYNAEYEIAATLRELKSAAFTRLAQALEAVKENYDVVILDPPPALGMISLSVLYAANALIIPTPPSMNDFASTAAFLSMLHDTMSTLADRPGGIVPNYNFIHMVVAKADARNATHKSNTDLIEGVFGRMVLESHISLSAEFEHASSEMRSVFDPRHTTMNHSVRNRCLTMLNRLGHEIEGKIRKTWPSANDTE